MFWKDGAMTFAKAEVWWNNGAHNKHHFRLSYGSVTILDAQMF